MKINFKNIADFERNFTGYQLAALDSFKSPDMLIIRISENVDDKKAIDSNFILYFDRLIKYIDPNNKSLKVVVEGFWENINVNTVIKQYALKNKYPFIENKYLFTDSTNTAKGKYINIDVAKHPSDKGMRLIAESIWLYIKSYFIM